MNRVAILTNGGDAPGLNAVIRAIVKTAETNGIECYGYIEGYNSGNINYSGHSTIENNIIISSRYFSNGSGGVINNLQYSEITNNYVSATHKGEYYGAWVIGNITGGTIKNNILLNTGKEKNNVLTKNSNTTS